MNKDFELEIIRPIKKDLIRVEWIDVQTPSGNFLAGPGHENLISVLKERASFVFKPVNELEPISIDIYGGILKIENGKAFLITDL